MSFLVEHGILRGVKNISGLLCLLFENFSVEAADVFSGVKKVLLPYPCPYPYPYLSSGFLMLID